MIRLLVLATVAVLALAWKLHRDSRVWTTEPYADDDWLVAGYRRAGVL